MATPQDRRKELRRNPTNYLARANMGKYRAYLRERLAKKGVAKDKIDIKQQGNKFVFVSPNNQKTITKTNIAPPVNKTDSVDPRFKENLDKEITKIIRESEGTATIRKNSNPPKFEKRLTRKQLREMSPAERKAYNERRKKTPPASTPTVGGAKGRKERRGTSESSGRKLTGSDLLTAASLIGIGGVTIAGVRYLYKGGKIFAKTPLGQKAVNMGSALGKKVINAFKKKKAEKKADSPRDASAMKKSSSKKKESSSEKTERNMDKSLFTKRKQEKKTEEKVDDVRDIKKGVKGVSDKAPAGAKNTTMSKKTKPKITRDRTFTSRANKDRDKQNQRSKQDMAYDQAANPKKYLDALIVRRAKELGMTYNQLRYQVNRIFIRNGHQKKMTGGVKQKLNNVTSEQVKKGSPFMRDVKAFVDKMRTNKKYAKQTQGRTQAKLDLNKNKKETPPKKSLLKNRQEIFYAKLNKRFSDLVKEGKISPSERKLATQLREKAKETLRNPNATESAKQNAVQRYANQLEQIVKSTP
tara:strand:+ start:269 stop:1846 length:1578 start_codon:yes stop_codon:yes gene_type:complete